MSVLALVLGSLCSKFLEPLLGSKDQHDVGALIIITGFLGIPYYSYNRVLGTPYYYYYNRVLGIPYYSYSIIYPQGPYINSLSSRNRANAASLKLLHVIQCFQPVRATIDNNDGE